MDRKGELDHPGWCMNLIQAGRLQVGERVLVVVDAPLVEQGAQLGAAVRDAGGEPRLELWAGRRPFHEPPGSALEAARDADLMLALQQEPLGPEGAARALLRDALTDRGGRAIFLGFVDGPLLRGELSRPFADLSETAEALERALAGSKCVRVRGQAGTDLTVRVEGRSWLTDATQLVT